MIGRISRVFLAAALVAAGTWTGASAGDPAPVVVELFTSQGCSSCPPADAYLGELAKREDVIALSFHINYWDYIGWKDRFASAEATRRQRDYAKTLRRTYVYTPQMVIDGLSAEVGSKRAKVEDEIARLRQAAHRKLRITFQKSHDGALWATVPEGETRTPADVWLVLYDRSHTTTIKSGENRDRTLTYYNVVREIRHIGAWNGAKRSYALAIQEAVTDSRTGCVVIVQAQGMGPILGAAMEPFASAR